MICAVMVPRQVDVKYLIVEAKVRYWEDASVNGVEDADGTLVPLRAGDRWCPVIELETGQIHGWPAGTTADIHYKVCDDGEYWLGATPKSKTLKRKGHYVPSDLFNDDGCGDYIIMTIGADGKIEGWKKPELDGSDYELTGRGERTK